jgi:hypothetical protein
MVSVEDVGEGEEGKNTIGENRRKKSWGRRRKVVRAK